jgi:N-glycosylase/DNA lyase
MKMIQRMNALVDGGYESLDIPSADSEVLPGIKWGRFDQLFTPAFWYSQAWHPQNRERIKSYKIGESFLEEVVACLLGGHGMPAEVGLVAFRRIKACGLLQYENCSEAALLKSLEEPLIIRGRLVRYRYPAQRAGYIANAIERLHMDSVPTHSDLALREWLQGLTGVGPKTASWIVRNHLDSDNVAIIDIHVFRAGVLLGIFDRGANITRHYAKLESRLLALAQAMKLHLATLDTLIWGHMRHLSSVAIETLSSPAIN